VTTLRRTNPCASKTTARFDRRNATALSLLVGHLVEGASGNFEHRASVGNMGRADASKKDAVALRIDERSGGVLPVEP
jgi:hypothetical protein